MKSSTISNRARATWLGTIAVLLWSCLALLTVRAGEVPPFQLTAICLFIGSVLPLAGSHERRRRVLDATRLLLRASAFRVWAIGVTGIFGFHFFYFTAFDRAPAVEASLIAYLWPVLMVLFSAALPGGRVRRAHLLGIGLGFGGVFFLVAGQEALEVRPEFLVGYASAAACGVIWAGYSVLSRLHARVPTESVALFCFVSALCSGLCHLAFEQTTWPAHWSEWGAMFALGVGPLGLAFYTWDVGVKQGHIHLLATLSYFAPLLSTTWLILAGEAEPTWNVGAAALAITGGAVLASRTQR